MKNILLAAAIFILSGCGDGQSPEESYNEPEEGEQSVPLYERDDAGTDTIFGN